MPGVCPMFHVKLWGTKTGLVADFDEAVSRETVAGDTAVQKEDLWGQIPLNFASHCRWVGLAFGR